MTRRLKELLREPLLHFLLLGAALFMVFSAVSQRAGRGTKKIVITQGQIEHLATGFSRTWRRPPTAEELDGLLREYIREEVYYREALVMGLDRDDTVIRSRLRQKLEFISEDVAALPEPSDADLRAFLQSHPDSFRTEQRFTFSHVYLDPGRRRDSLARDAADLLIRLKQAGMKVDAAMLGDPFLLAAHFDDVPSTEIAAQFGETFAGALSSLQPGDWQGPVVSGFGVHLVRILQRTEGRIPALEEVREAVHREWISQQRRKANEGFFRELLGHYTVIVDPPHVDPPQRSKAEATPMAEAPR